eukprot:767748-Hanusia_phi.AAC.1
MTSYKLANQGQSLLGRARRQAGAGRRAGPGRLSRTQLVDEADDCVESVRIRPPTVCGKEARKSEDAEMMRERRQESYHAAWEYLSPTSSEWVLFTKDNCAKLSDASASHQSVLMLSKNISIDFSQLQLKNLSNGQITSIRRRGSNPLVPVNKQLPAVGAPLNQRRVLPAAEQPGGPHILARMTESPAMQSSSGGGRFAKEWEEGERAARGRVNELVRLACSSSMLEAAKTCRQIGSLDDREKFFLHNLEEAQVAALLGNIARIIEVDPPSSCLSPDHDCLAERGRRGSKLGCHCAGKSHRVKEDSGYDQPAYEPARADPARPFRPGEHGEKLEFASSFLPFSLAMSLPSLPPETTPQGSSCGRLRHAVFALQLLTRGEPGGDRVVRGWAEGN